MTQYFQRKYPILQCYLVTHIQLISWVLCFASGEDEFLLLLLTAFMLTSLFCFGFTQTEFPEVPASGKTLTLCRWRWPRMIFLTQLRLPTNLGRDWRLSNEVAWLLLLRVRAAYILKCYSNSNTARKRKRYLARQLHLHLLYWFIFCFDQTRSHWGKKILEQTTQS